MYKSTSRFFQRHKPGAWQLHKAHHKVTSLARRKSFSGRNRRVNGRRFVICGKCGVLIPDGRISSHLKRFHDPSTRMKNETPHAPQVGHQKTGLSNDNQPRPTPNSKDIAKMERSEIQAEIMRLRIENQKLRDRSNPKVPPSEKEQFDHKGWSIPNPISSAKVQNRPEDDEVKQEKFEKNMLQGGLFNPK